GPNGAAVNYVATATDAATGNPVPVSCTPPPGSVFPVGASSITCTTGTTVKSFTITVTDTTPPTIHVPANIVQTNAGASGAIVTSTATATDLVDGTDPVTCAPASGSLFPVGPSTVHCTSTDAHGNTAMATFTITVGYQWCGIGQPINGDGTSIFKLGSTVPIKFQLCRPSAGLVITAHIAIYFVSGGIPGTVN